MMDGHGQSDGCVVPGKSPNKPVEAGAEGMEGRRPAKGNAQECAMPRTQGRDGSMPAALECIRLAVRRDKGEKLTSLYHHVYNVDHLREAYWGLKRRAAPGVDGETWQHYGQDLEANLQDLSGRLARGAYRANPVRRAYIPKLDGRQRPLGVPALHVPIPDQGKWLRTVLNGHFRYYGVPMNGRALTAFRLQVAWLWKGTLARRSP